MTNEQRERMNELNRELLWCEPEEFEVLYAEYEQLVAMDRQDYRKRNEGKLLEYFQKNILPYANNWGSVNEQDASFYSDWHKDVFGYRPRGCEFNPRCV